MTKKFTVQGYKGVKEISLSPTGSLVVIAGGNGAGKSSFIDAITELFDPHGVKLTPRPIHDGEDEARAEFTDDELDVRIVRTWRENGTPGRLEVFALDGARYQKPAEVVAALTGGALFDPEEFLRLSDRDQRDQLLGRVDLPFDLDALGRKRAGAFERRRDLKRDLDKARAVLANMPKIPADVPTEEVSAYDIIGELTEATAAHRRAAEEEAAEERLTQEVERLTAALESAMTDLDNLHKATAERPPLPDVAEIQARLDGVTTANANAREAKSREAAAHHVDQIEQRIAETQQELDAIDAQKSQALAAAAFPVPGLSIDDDGVTFEGVPFKQVNTARRRAIAFDLATSATPDLRIVVVKDGDLLDSETLALIREIAESREYTVLVERDRDESREIGFTIIDGELAETGASA